MRPERWPSRCCRSSNETPAVAQNDEYAIQKRYMSLESLVTMSENPPIRLPAAPALARS